MLVLKSSVSGSKELKGRQYKTLFGVFVCLFGLYGSDGSFGLTTLLGAVVPFPLDSLWKFGIGKGTKDV